MTEQDLKAAIAAAYEAELQRYVWSDGKCHALDGEPVPAPVSGEEMTPIQQEVLRLIWAEKTDEERAVAKKVRRTR